MKFKALIALAVLAFSLSVFAQQPVNNVTINGTAISTGNGTAGAGVQRVSIASDNTAFAVNATLSAETTKVIGTVNMAAAQTIAVTNSGTFAVQATLSAETTKVIGTTRLQGNIGGVMDFIGQNAAQPANSLLIGGEFNTAPTTITTGNASPLQLDSTGKLIVNCATGCTAGSGTTSLIPATSGGVTMSHLVTAATTNATSLKGSAGQLYGASIYNNAVYPIYLKFSNKATAPTCGTDAVVYSVPVQAGTEREVHSEEGLAFATGIGYCVTKGITDADATAVALSDASVDLQYK
jgi:hypothetical protein